jgi:hypothetical protein
MEAWSLIMEAWKLIMESWGDYRSVVAGLHHYDEGTGSCPDPHESKMSDPDPHKGEKRDPDPH